MYYCNYKAISQANQTFVSFKPSDKPFTREGLRASSEKLILSLCQWSQSSALAPPVAFSSSKPTENGHYIRAEFSRTGCVLGEAREPVWAVVEMDGQICAGVDDVRDGDKGPGLDFGAASEAAGGTHAVPCEVAGAVGG